jgi:hypothetical protein
MIDDGTGTSVAPGVVGGPPPEQGGGRGAEYVPPALDDPYLAYGRFKYGTTEGTLGGTAIDPTNPSYFSKEGRAIADATVTPVTSATSVTSVDRVTPVDPVPGGKRADAKNTIKAVLATYGLGESLAKKLYDLYATGTVDINNPDALIFAIRNEEEYLTRFAGNKARAKKGLSELDPGSYIALEDNYRRLMQSNGLPSGFYDQTDDFTRLIEGDVSAQELQDRVQNGFRAVQDADPEVKRQMQELYGVNEAGLAAYFLDPTKAAPILTRQAEAAKISARAKGLANVQLTALTAEELAARGITQAEAEAGFTKLGLQQGLYTEMAGEQGLTQQQKVGAALGTDINAQTILEQRKSSRLSPFKGGGKFTSTTGQTSGTTESGLNVAQ